MMAAPTDKERLNAVEKYAQRLWPGGDRAALAGRVDGDRARHPGSVDGGSELLQPLVPQRAFLAPECRTGVVRRAAVANVLALLQPTPGPTTQPQALGA